MLFEKSANTCLHHYQMHVHITQVLHKYNHVKTCDPDERERERERGESGGTREIEREREDVENSYISITGPLTPTKTNISLG